MTVMAAATTPTSPVYTPLIHNPVRVAKVTPPSSPHTVAALRRSAPIQPTSPLAIRAPTPTKRPLRRGPSEPVSTSTDPLVNVIETYLAIQEERQELPGLFRAGPRVTYPGLHRAIPARPEEGCLFEALQSAGVAGEGWRRRRVSGSRVRSLVNENVSFSAWSTRLSVNEDDRTRQV